MTEISLDEGRERPRSTAATLHAVARGRLSLATASPALNGSKRAVAEASRERVEAAVALLGYPADRSAQATARGTSVISALRVADITHPYLGLIASVVGRGADEATHCRDLGAAPPARRASS